MSNANVCSNDVFPFTYFNENGQPVEGVLNNGSCVFPEANCGVDTTVAECCKLSDYVQQDDNKYTVSTRCLHFFFTYDISRYLHFRDYIHSSR